MDQSLYQGGKISGGVDVAQHLRDAEDAHLHAVEQAVLLDAAQAYMGVLEAQAVLQLEQSNENVLKQALDAAQASFDNGEVTHTDVDQAKARLAGTQAARIQAEGAVISAMATYERVIGTQPDSLQQPAALNGLPANQQAQLEQAFRRYTVATYVNSFDSYDGQRFVVKPETRAVGEDRVVETQIIPRSGSSHELDYVMRQEGARWKAVDVLADGSISRVAVQRSDFRRLVARGGAQALIDSLDQKTKDLSSGTMQP